MNIIDEYHSRFYVNAGSPSGLSWLNDRYSGGFGGGRIIAKAGDMVGHLRKDGYYSTYINDKEYLLHRVVWEMENNLEIPTGMYVDHIDGVRSNNILSNLRIVSAGDNNRNCWRRSTNKSGKTGVYLHRNIRDGKVSELWAASWTDGRGHSKISAFSIRKYGYEEAFRLACEKRDQEIEKLCNQGFNYTERHGIDEGNTYCSNTTPD